MVNVLVIKEKINEYDKLDILGQIVNLLV